MEFTNILPTHVKTHNKVWHLGPMSYYITLFRRFCTAVYWWREEDPFHFWRFSLLPFQSYWTWYDEDRNFTLYRMITWVVFLRMFWNFISSLPVKGGGSLSFFGRTIRNVLAMETGWTDVGSNTSCIGNRHDRMIIHNTCFAARVISQKSFDLKARIPQRKDGGAK